LTEQVRERSCGQSRFSGHDLRFGVGVHETSFRVNVRWVTPLGEEIVIRNNRVHNGASGAAG
jgi:hypothetical protein